MRTRFGLRFSPNKNPERPNTLKSRSFWFVILLLLCVSCASHAESKETSTTIQVDASAPAHPFPHFWEQMFGSGRAILSLRASYREDLRAVHQITNFKYVRFHAIFHDEVGIYEEDPNGKPLYNFSYIDQIYDGLLAEGVKPFVELSFMPNKLAAHTVFQAFWYKPDVSPPRDWNRWDALISAFIEHLIARYGIDEVATWYFEVWNEPNLDFWAGEPKQQTYFQLYDHTSLAIKRVNSRLRVGGPATAQAAWVTAFLEHCHENKIPVDFVSTHVYANDTAMDVFHTNEEISRDQMVCRAVRKVHDEIAASATPHLPLLWTEFNASYKNEPSVTDSAFMGPWLAETVRACDGFVDMMSYWTFSDVFEEQGVVKTPFYGGYGLIAEDSIPKPAFHAFRLLHKLGDKRIALDSDYALLTRRRDGTLVIALWNYDPPDEPGPSKEITLQLKNTKATRAIIWRVDSTHGDFHEAYTKMKEPRIPSRTEIRELRAATQIQPPEHRAITNGRIRVEIPPFGLAVIELQ
jgi:xylan 1,4-beta-xylosidase